jgi:hypothetical protein
MKELKFLPEFIDPILNGTKTQTARMTLTAVNVGDDVVAISKGKKFATLRITSIEKRMLGTFGPADAKREGLNSFSEFDEVWKRIHPRKGFVNSTLVYVIRFEVIEVVKRTRYEGIYNDLPNRAVYRGDPTVYRVPRGYRGRRRTYGDS